MSVTQVAVSHTRLADATEAGVFLGSQIADKLGGATPDVVIVFASSGHSYGALLLSINLTCNPALMVGCSSAGEFSGAADGDAISSASVMAIRADDMLFHAGVGRKLRENQAEAVRQLLPAFNGASRPDYPFKSALILTDALAGYADELIYELTVRTGGAYQLFGGGAADDAKFQETHVFLGTDPMTDAVVALEILSKKPLGIGVKHGWKACGKALRVTEAQGARIVSLNAMPAADAFEEHAIERGQTLNRSDPLPFFLHNVIGIDTGDGCKIRVPLALEADGSILCAADVPTGATVYIMSATDESACDAGRQAAEAAVDGLHGAKLAGSLVFDCAATRLRMGTAFGDELKAIGEALGSTNYAGCNTYGQIARAENQFSGFHNCTAIVCAIPE